MKIHCKTGGSGYCAFAVAKTVKESGMLLVFHQVCHIGCRNAPLASTKRLTNQSWEYGYRQKEAAAGKRKMTRKSANQS
jgi:hypothetical protein